MVQPVYNYIIVTVEVFNCGLCHILRSNSGAIGSDSNKPFLCYPLVWIRTLDNLFKIACLK